MSAYEETQNEDIDHDQQPEDQADDDTDPDDPLGLRVGPYRWSHRSVPLLDDALAAAQGEMDDAEFNRKNSHLGNSYADLKAVFKAIRGPLSRHGIARYQTPYTHPDDGKLYVTTRLACRGQWVEADFRVVFEAQKGLRAIQSAGSALTFVKRYAIVSMAGVASGEDDDDGEGSGDPSPGRSKPTAKQPSRPASKPQPSKWAIGVEAFGKLGVHSSALLVYLGRESEADVTDHDHTKLESLFKSNRAGDERSRNTILALASNDRDAILAMRDSD